MASTLSLPNAKIWTLLAVDDEPDFLHLTQDLLAGHPRIRVASLAASGEEALDRLPRLNANAVLMDVNMPGLSGFDVARRIARSYPWLRVLLMTAEGGSNLESSAREVGAIGCLFKADLRAERVLDLLDQHWSESKIARRA
ncbi:MAG: response regulator [Chloroflexi bacterium]|nr:response regulator [Chloroflexota bacterium]MCH8195039.1 response regulator [Chloroflexota bacterium]